MRVRKNLPRESYGTAKSRALTLVWSMDAVRRCSRMRGVAALS
jgi:hypothetical protein